MGGGLRRNCSSFSLSSYSRKKFLPHSGMKRTGTAVVPRVADGIVRLADGTIKYADGSVQRGSPSGLKYAEGRASPAVLGCGLPSKSKEPLTRDIFGPQKLWSGLKWEGEMFVVVVVHNLFLI